MTRSLVVGLGRFGGGEGALRFLADRGDEVLVSDSAPEAAFADVVAAWRDHPRVTFSFGPQTPELLAGRDLVVASPAVPPEAPILRAARERGLPVTTELALFLERAPRLGLAVTGSNGKSTTAELLAAMLRAAGRTVEVAGNMGRSLLPEVATLPPETELVLEISSFQLEAMALPTPPLRGAIITGITPNHLDRHGDMARYVEAKSRVLELVADGGSLVAPRDLPALADWRAAGRLDRLREIAVESLPADVATAIAAGAPNRIIAFNARQAAALAGATGPLGVAAVTRALAEFRPLRHRLEEVARRGDLRFVDDSKSTTPEATAAGVAAFEGPIHLVCGGYDKGLDPAPLLDAARRCASVRLLGATAEDLEGRLRGHADLARFTTLSSLLDDVFARVRSGCVLLSPGHASYGLWRDYRARGEDFRRGIRERLGEGEAAPAATDL
ncbi:MAG: UDP-N-acetylmuramoyl-L-alanine--D-glutamate ligase [Planctomycetota bacterium]